MANMSVTFWVLSGVSFVFIIIVLIYLLTRKMR